MKKDLLSIVKFFSLAIVFLAFSFSVNAERRGLKNLTDSSKAGYSRFAPAPFKVDAAYKYRATDFGNALNFDGVNDFVTISATGFTFPNNEWTEEMWLYLPAVPSAQFTGVIGSEDMAVWSKRGPFLQITSVNGLHGGFGYGTGQTQHFYDVRNVLVIGAWNHVAQTYDGSRLKVYVNGNIAGDVSAPSTVSNANPIKYLGGEQPGVSIRFKGSMDEVRFWKRARTEAEIKSNYNKTVNATDPDLLLYYSFNQGVANGDNTSISSVTDNTGKFNGSLNNFTLNGTSSNFVGSFFLEAPTANAATNITDGSFTANWAALSGVTVNNYILEVARDANFISLVSGYENLSVPAGTTSQAVTGLSPNSTYYYRVKAVSGAATSLSSNVIQVKTLALTGFGNALNFDGSGDYVAFSKGGISFPNNQWTEEMWVYVPSSIGGGFKNLLVTNPIFDITSPLRGPVMYIYNKTQLCGGYGDGTNWKYYITSKQAFQLDGWTHIAQTFDGTDLKVYINGAFRESFNMPGISNVNKINYIGNAENASSSESFLGNIDEVRIWSRALTEAEIKKNYNISIDQSAVGFLQGLMAYYDFNQGIAGGNNTLIDTLIDSKNAYNASLNNFTKDGATSNFVGDLKLVPPVASAADNIGADSFKAKWVAGANSVPVAVKYFLDVSTDATFADAGKFVSGYRNKDVGNVTDFDVKGLNSSTTYYYRLRAGYATPWFHPSVNSNTITVSTMQANNITLAATDVKTYGDAPYQLAVSSSGTGAYTYTITAGDAVSISNTGQVTILKAGTVTITVTQAADAVYGSAGPATQTITVQPKRLTVTVTAADKEYNGSNAAIVTLLVTGTVYGDIITATAGGATFDNKNAGTGKPVTVTGITFSGAKASNYALANTPTTTATITAKPVKIILTANNKKYDGNAAATGSLTVNGVITGDNVTATAGSIAFADKNVGTGKTVTATGISLNSNNYTAITPVTSTGNITAKAVTVTFVANNKVFDNNTTATGVLTVTDLEAGDVATATAAAMNFADPAVGANKTVTATGISINNPNYAPLNTTATSTANISGKSVTVTINQVASKVYNGNATASATFNISGLAAGETLTVISADVTFADKNVGTGKPVTATNFKLSDVNYSAANSSATSTGNITAKSVTVTFVANNKVFDNNTTATGVLTVTDLEAGDVATATAAAMNFADPAVGANKPVTATGISINNPNYAPLNTTATSTANISGKSVTVTINQVASKVYNGNATASATFNIIGLAAGETLTVISADVTFADKNVGTGKPVTATNFKLSDVNYSAANSSATSTGNITAKAVTVTFKANNKVFDNNTTATGVLTVTDLEAGDVATATAAAMNFADPAVGANKTVTATGISINNPNYAPLNTTATSTANISGKSVTVTINQVASKVYNGNATASATFNIIGLAAGETLTVISADVTFADKNVGTGKPVTATNFKLSDVNYSAANSSATSTGNITAKAVTVTFVANNKVFDNNTTATGVLTVTDLEAGDVATATAAAMNFADPAVGANKTVTATGISINNPNYAPLNTTATSTANISGKSVTVTINQVASKVYNGNATANATFNIIGLAAGETLTVISADVTFADKNVGTGKPVTATNFKLSDVNYSAANSSATSTGNITAKAVTVTFVANNKVFDNNTTATGVLTVTDLEAGDVATATAAAMNFADPAIGANKTVTATGISINNPNYAPLNTTATSTANISGKSVTVTINQVASKVYNGNATASATFNIIGLAAGETLTVISADVTFADKNVGTGKPVTATNFKLSDVNYSAANSSATSTGNITAKAVTVTFVANNKVFDNNTTATGVLTVTDLEAGDVATATAAAMNFADPAVGANKTVTATGISINNPNYAPLNTTATSTANISGKSVTVTINQVASKVYNGNATANATFNIIGLAAGETLTVISADVTFADKNVGTGKPVTATNFKLSDVNYSAANSSATSTGNITAKAVTVTFKANNKVFDNNTTATGVLTVTDLEAGDVATATAAAMNFADPAIGANKPVTATGISINNPNYAPLNTTATSTANISGKSVTVTINQVASKVYNGNATANATFNISGLAAGETVTVISADVTFVDKNVGTGKPVTATNFKFSDVNYSAANSSATSTGNITAKAVTVTFKANNKGFDNNTTATGVLTVTDLEAGDVATATASAMNFADPAIGANKTVTATGISINNPNYAPLNTTATSTANISGKSVTVTINQVASKVYDGNATANATFNITGLAAGETLTVISADVTFADKNVGTGKPVTATNFKFSDANYSAANSSATSTGNITAKAVTVTFKANNKGFDNNTTATGVLTVTDLEAGDVATATAAAMNFADPAIGANKTVTATGISINNPNYAPLNTTATSTANISGKLVTVIINQVASKVYDGNTTASATFNISGLAAGETLTVISADVTFVDKNVGTGKPVTATNFKFSDANYSAANSSATSTGNITAKSVTVTFKANNKVFDNNTTATGVLTVTDLEAGDVATATAAAMNFADPAIGANKTVTATGISINNPNYAPLNTTATSTANISGKLVTVIINQVASKVYDGNATANATFNITGLAAGETLTVISADVTFADKNVGTGKPVTATNFKFSDANYSAANSSATSTGNITAKAVTVTFKANNKVFDNNTTATGVLTVTDLEAGDVATATAAAMNFADPAIGANKTVTATGISINNPNYAPLNTTATSTANISGKLVTVIINQVASKVYDGNTTASATFNISGLAAGETLTVISADVTFVDKNVGTGKPVTATNFKFSDANYSASNSSANYTGNITAKPVKIILTVNDKEYDGSLIAGGMIIVSASDLVSGETITATASSITFSDKNAGTGKLVTATGINLSNNNYMAITPVTSTANITAKAVTVTFKANNKVFDNNTTATGVLTVTGLEAGDVAAASAAAMNFADPAIGANKTVTATGISINNPNYRPLNTTATSTANISGKGVTVTINQVASKVYNGNTTASATFNITGLATGETVTVISADVTFSDKNVGTGKPVTATNFKFSDVNYSASNSSATSTGNITPKDLIITADNKTKLPGEDNPPLTASYSGFVSGENNTNALTAQPLLTTPATKASPPGNYPIEISGAVAANSNYNIIYNKGSLTISTVVITAVTLTTNTLYANSPKGTLAGTLTASSTEPNAIYAYSLVPGVVDNDKFIINGDKLYTNAVFDYATQNTFTVRIQVNTQSGGMLTKDFILAILYVNGSPTIDAIPDQSICATTENNTINLSGITPGFEANQTTALSITSNNKDMFNALSVTPLSGGKGIVNYSLKAGVSGSAVITVTVKDDGGTADGGIDTYSVSFTVNVNPLPVISISTSTGKLKIIRGRTIELTANAPGTTAYSWADAKGIINGQNTARLTVKPTERTVYTVKATSAAGCVDVKQITIEVGNEYSDVIANNIITPNGDGVNDVWIIENIEQYPNATVKVFDIARHLIFSQTNYDNKWNGYFDGKPLHGGTYYYVIDFGADLYKAKGYITIINEQ